MSLEPKIGLKIDLQSKILIFFHATTQKKCQKMPKIAFKFNISTIKIALLIIQGDWLITLPIFFKKSKRRFVVEYCDWSHFKDYLSVVIVLEFHWSREIISLWNRPITKRPYFPGILFHFLIYKRTPQDIETILTLFNVFSNYTYCVQISDFHSYFYYCKT